MFIREIEVSLKALVGGFSDRDEEGVVAFNGKLNVRPPYQREFIYSEEQQKRVIESILNQRPINVFYWGRVGDADNYELIDGQQRTMSICRFVHGGLHANYKGTSVAFANLTNDEQRDFLSYKWRGYTCDGTDRERLEWFKTINIATEKLTDQELRNAVYAGPWLSSAKKYFSKTSCPAYNIGSDFISGDYLRQEVLEEVLSWAADADGCTIEDYMASHSDDANAEDLWKYFRSVIEWVRSIFDERMDRDMQKVHWGILYNRYHDSFVVKDKDSLNEDIDNLRDDDDVTRNSGIYEYVLSGKTVEKGLSLRKFPEKIAKKIYKQQGGYCPSCHGWFPFDKMEADHIIPWSKGGTTTEGNCQMLCKNCNRRKSNV